VFVFDQNDDSMQKEFFNELSNILTNFVFCVYFVTCYGINVHILQFIISILKFKICKCSIHDIVCNLLVYLFKKYIFYVCVTGGHNFSLNIEFSIQDYNAEMGLRIVLNYKIIEIYQYNSFSI
jgi:hypothetical protein